MSALKAEFIDTKRLPRLKQYRIILQVPIEDQKKVHDILGYPDGNGEVWVGIARLMTPSETQPGENNKTAESPT